jgi:succinyl-diaminopimelate desuccinylase
LTIAPDTVRADAERQVDSIVDLARHLVRIPSRGGLDDYRPVVERLAHWLRVHDLRPGILHDGGLPVAVVCDVDGDRPGPHYVLDACLDTADIGDRGAWHRDPYSSEVAAGWLHGRGTADSKTAVALFSHLAADLATSRDFAGRLTLLFDLDEHAGGFAGIRRYLDTLDRDPDGVYIGYPGNERIIVGGRGFWRAKVTMFGRAEHSATKRDEPCNAVTRAADLVSMLDVQIPTGTDPTLGLPPKVTVTSIRGGTAGSFSVVPDRAEVEVDVRLTPTFTAADAEAHLRRVLAAVNLRDDPPPRPEVIEQVTESWPPFRLADDHPLPSALLAGARAAGLDPELAVAGPSNIGCLLAARGIPATAGFGVTYRGLHAADEAIEIASIPGVYVAYREALRRLLVAS